MELTHAQRAQAQDLLRQVYTHAQLSRTQLAQLTGITPATTSRLTGELLRRGVLTEAGREGASAAHTGPRQTLLTVAEGGPVFLGVELTAASFAFCLCDRAGHVRASQVIQRAHAYERTFLNTPHFIACLQAFLAAHADLPPVAAGIALPGHYLARTGRIVSANPTWAFFELGPISAALTIPVFYENNVHCEALAESLVGPTRDGANFVFVHAARGIFSSTVTNGQLYGTDNFVVGEISHVIIDPDGELCDCGRHGCLQTLASTESIVKKARLLARSAPDSLLNQLAADPTDIHIETVIAAYQMGDRGVIAILTSAIRALAGMLNTLGLLIDARRMIVHGLIFDQPDLYRRLQQFLDANQFQLTAVAPQQLLVKPFAPLDGAIGGAMLAVDHTLLRGDWAQCPVARSQQAAQAGQQGAEANQ